VSDDWQFMPLGAVNARLVKPKGGQLEVEYFPTGRVMALKVGTIRMEVPLTQARQLIAWMDENIPHPPTRWQITLEDGSVWVRYLEQTQYHRVLHRDPEGVPINTALVSSEEHSMLKLLEGGQFGAVL